MSAQIISGTEVSSQILEEIKIETTELKARYGITPGLVTILVGEDPASKSYVTSKGKRAKEMGFHSIQENRPDTISEKELLDLVEQYNQDPAIHGILIQLPLPKHINEEKVIMAINPEKDVDCFHPANVGKVMIGNAVYLPCTPAGIQEMLVRSGVETSGAEVVVVGRSNIVGKPIANMLIQKAAGANATVTICHTRTKDLAFHTKRADILIVAAGVKECISGEMIKPGAVVIDVGIHRIGVTESGKAKLCGDVEFQSASQVAGKITPVPGGVGPMTITMLMKNTLKAAKATIS